MNWDIDVGCLLGEGSLECPTIPPHSEISFSDSLDCKIGFLSFCVLSISLNFLFQAAIVELHPSLSLCYYGVGK
jgi:hypothetical protein